MPHLKTSRSKTTRTSCNLSVGKQIRKETRANRQKPISERRSKQQVQAIGFSKVRKQRPECKRFIRKRK